MGSNGFRTKIRRSCVPFSGAGRPSKPRHSPGAPPWEPASATILCARQTWWHNVYTPSRLPPPSPPMRALSPPMPCSSGRLSTNPGAPWRRSQPLLTPSRSALRAIRIFPWSRRSLCRGLLFEDDSLREPLLNVLARYLTCRNCQKHGNNFLIRCTQFCFIQFQKDFCHCRGHAFVTIQECMGLCLMICIRRGTSGESCLFVIRPVFHSRQRGFQCPGIAHTMQSPKFLDGPRLESEHFVCP